jgi:hypothetical protein
MVPVLLRTHAGPRGDSAETRHRYLEEVAANRVGALGETALPDRAAKIIKKTATPVQAKDPRASHRNRHTGTPARPRSTPTRRRSSLDVEAQPTDPGCLEVTVGRRPDYLPVTGA